ncbi:MAG: hypothetical protein P8P99_07235, partial [Maricaulis sp.]|nr:hypothetical protein [Maricaulis sp.]
AMAITGIGPDVLTDPTLPSNYEMAIELSELFQRWGPSVFIGHNSIGFAEDFLRQLFYQSLLPVYVTNTSGRSRADTLIMARVFAQLYPDKLQTVKNDKGASVFKLEGMARLNGFGEFAAHDALADVEATVFLAKIMRDADPELFTHLIRMGRKSEAEDMAMSPTPFLLPATSKGEALLLPMIGLLEDPGQHARVLAVDLRHDIDAIRAIDFDRTDALAALKVGGDRAFRKVATNRQPAILDINHSEIDGDELARLHQTAKELLGDQDLLNLLTEFLLRTQTIYGDSEHLEDKIYDGFPSRADQSTMRVFHNESWERRAWMIDDFEDDRYRQIAIRLVAEHDPHFVNEDVLKVYQDWVEGRQSGGLDDPWTTAMSARAELRELRSDTSVSTKFCNEIDGYLKTFQTSEPVA